MKNGYRQVGDTIVITVKRIGGADAETIIDASDLVIAERNANTWWVTAHGYVGSQIRSDGVRKNVLLHRWISDASDCVLIDHENRDKLDNRRSNLRPASRGLNSLNRSLQTNNTSGYRGVTLHKSTGRWLARIHENGKQRCIGRFDDPVSAYVAFEAAYEEQAARLTGS